MPQVNVLSVDLVQPIEKAAESDSFSSSSKGGGAFADLVEQQISKDAHGKEKAAKDVQRGNDRATNSTANEIDKEQPPATTKEKVTETKESEDRSTVDAKEKLEHSTTQPIDENTTDEISPELRIKEDTGNDESERLLNFLSASGDMLKDKSAGSTADTVGTEKAKGETITKLELKHLLQQSTESLATEGEHSKGAKSAGIAEELVSELDKMKQDKLNVAKDKLASEQLVELPKNKLFDEMTRELKSSDGVLASDKKSSSTNSQLQQPNILTQLQNITAQEMTEAELAALAEELELDPSAKEKLASLLDKETLSRISNKQQSDVAAKDSSSTSALKSTNHDQQGVGKASSNAGNELEAEQLTKAGDNKVDTAQVAGGVKSVDADSGKLADTSANSRVKNILGRAENQTPTAQNDASEEQGESNAKSEANLLNQVAQKSEKEEVLIKPEKVLEKGMVAETLQMNGSIVNSANVDAERITESANEQLVEQVANRVVKENNQVQKAQIATDTIAIYKKEFANEVKEKVMVMINQKLQQVDIQLDPPELGNMHVRVNLQNEQASVSFVVQNQQAKDALEQHMNKLRDMLSESGVDVGESNIEHRNASSDQEAGERSKGQMSGNESDDGNAQIETLTANMVKASAVGVDFYA